MKRNILVLAVFGVALAVAGFFAGTGSQASPPADKFINLATAGAEVTHNGALFTQGGIGAGTGNFNPFLTLSPGGSANTEQGYNSVKGTPGIPQFDEFYGGGRTQAIQAAAIPAFDPPPVGGPLYRVILLDANDRGSDAYNSLDTLKVFLDNQPNLAQYNNNANTFGTDDGTKASLIFNMDDNCPGGDCVALLLSQGLEPGSGISDISVALPDSLFPPECYYGSQTCNEWFYLFTQMGGYVDNGTDPVAGTQNWNVTAGFEEWRTELVPVVNVTKTAAVSYKITYDWTLEKEVSKDGGNTWEKAPSATIEVGDSQNYLWRLVATRLPGVVSQQVVSGTVTITNPTGGAVITKPIPATITSIVDAIDTPDIPDVALTCGGVAYTGQAITLGAGQTLTCTYSVAAPGATNTTTGTNTVTVAVQDAGTDFVATAGFKFADATVTEIDEQALLQDPEVTPDQLLSETPAEPFQSSTQTYTCGSTNTIVNSGKLTETDSGQVRPSSAQITIICVDARIDLTPITWTNEVNSPHTVTCLIKQDDGLKPAEGGDAVDGLGPAPNGTVCTLSLLPPNTAGASFVGGVNTCSTTGGSCTVQINATKAGSVDIHGTTTFLVGGVSLTRSTNTAGNGTDVEKIYVDARISIAESGTNGITEPHTFTVKVEKNDGSGWVAAADETVTASETGVGDITGGTCDGVDADTDINGQCTIIVNSATAGSSTVNAAATVNVLGVDIDVATDGYGAFYVSNVKTWVDGSLRWEKRSASSTGPLLGGATFEACRTHDRFGNDIADECVTVVDDVDTVPGPGPDMDPDAGEFMLDNLKLGRWTIRETVTPPGYVGDPFIETIELTLASPDKTATHIWVNTPAQGCTPGFWGGGAGSVLWDGKDDTIVTTLVDAFVALGMTPLQAEDVLNIDGSNKGPHFASWYEVFAVPSLMRLADHSGDNLTDPLTLYDTTPQGGKASGGDAGKLARFATASLLNATAREAGLMPAYAFDVATVLDMVQDAWAAHLLGDDATMSAIANELAAASNLFCPLP